MCGASCGPGGDGRRRATAAHAACVGKGSTADTVGRARGGAHEEHCGHARDAVGVEAQRLVERRRGLPRVKGGHAVCGASSFGPGGAGRRRATAAHAACGDGIDCRLGGRARGGAHVQHAAHVRDAGGVEAQRLIERRRGLPRVEKRAWSVRDKLWAGRGGGRRRATAAHAAWVQGRARLQIRGRAQGGAHGEHMDHARDAGGVEAQRLVER